MHPSTRAQIVTRRTYCRPKNEEGTVFENWEEVIDRVITHQRWLWERALTHQTMPEMPLNDVTEGLNEWVHLTDEQEDELESLRKLMLERKVAPAGRTLWLGGTEIGKRIELSQFNCCFVSVRTVYDVVDFFWGLLNGAGVTGLAEVGNLTGFKQKIPELEIIRTKRGSYDKGPEENSESWNPHSHTWVIKVGDSAKAWAKSIGKLMAGKYPAKKLILDFSQIRGGGARLKNYGWLSQGDNGLSKAYEKIFHILNSKADCLLSEIDIGDIINLLGTVLSTRRAAEALLMHKSNPRWKEFARVKQGMWENGNEHRAQSNNSILFFEKPKKKELAEFFEMLNLGGNGEPGLVNAKHMLDRSPWAKGLNPSLRKGTRVFTNKGILPIESLVDDYFEVFTIKGTYEDAGCRLSGRNKQLLKINLEGGLSYYATKEHNWPIYRRVSRDVWGKEPFKVTTDQILPGDALVNILRDSLYPEAKQGTYNEGFFLGWLLGDGWITVRKDNGKHQIGLILSNEDYTSPIKDILVDQLKLWGCEANFKSRGSSWELNTQNEVLWKHISSYGVTTKGQLPTSIFDSTFSENYRKGFVDGTFSSDGHVEKTSSGYHIRPGINTCSETRHNDLKELLGFYGIKVCSSHSIVEANFPNGNTYEGKKYNQYSLRFSSAESIEHFYKLFRLTHPRKQQLLDEAIENYYGKVKHTMVGKIRIESVEYTELYEDVYDIGVYDTSHTFQLAHGMTGNCFEILLADGNTCNLVTIDLAKFKKDSAGLLDATRLIARANYRQTVVDLRDGILQEKWHLNNEHLHLCGVSLMGIAMRPDMQPYDFKRIERMATFAAYTMADELGTPHPKNITA